MVLQTWETKNQTRSWGLHTKNLKASSDNLLVNLTENRIKDFNWNLNRSQQPETKSALKAFTTLL